MKKIRDQLIFWYSLGILITVLLLIILFYSATQIVFYRQVDETLKIHLTALAGDIGINAKGTGCNCLSRESTFLTGILQMPGMPTAVLDENRQIIKESVDWHKPEKPISSYQTNNYFNDKLAGLSYRFLILPVLSGNTEIGFVMMGHPIDAFLKTRTTMAGIMIVLFLALIIPTLILGRFLAEKAITKEKQFLNDMAHSLKTPLAVLQTQLESSTNLDKVELLTNVKKISQTVTETLEANYSESCHEKKPVDLTQLLIELIEIGQHLGKRGGIKILTTTFPNSSLFVVGNRQQLAKAIMAIMENAISYGKKGGWVKISLEQKNNRAILEITDNGRGISQIDLPLVFNRFYRGHNAKTKGSGLGLAIAKNIIEELSGTISLQSQEDQGTKVTVTLTSSSQIIN